MIKWIFRIAVPLIIIGVLLLLLHLISLNNQIYNSVKSRPYPNAKLSLLWADRINQSIIFPLAKMGRPSELAFKNSLIKEFMSLRDSLYDKGIQQIPENDGERDFWWTYIYFAEYKAVYARNYANFILGPTLEGIPFYKTKIDNLRKHLREIAKYKSLSDPEINKTRLDDYSGLAMFYIRDCEDFYSWFPKGEPYYDDEEANQYYSQELKFNKPFFKDAQEQIGHISDVLDGWFKLKQAILKNNPEEYKRFHTGQNALKEPLLVYEASVILLADKILDGKFDCQDPLVKMNLESQKAFPDTSQDPSLIPESLNARRTSIDADSMRDYWIEFYQLHEMGQSKLVEETLQTRCGR